MSTVGFVTGRVLWDQGVALTKNGVVRVKGSPIGATVGVDGTFTLKVPVNQQFDNYTLEFVTDDPAIGSIAITYPISLVENGVANLGDIFPWPLMAVTGQLLGSDGTDFSVYTVYVESTGAAARAGADGFFVIPRVPPGRRNINAWAGTTAVAGKTVDLYPGTLGVVNLTLP